MAQEQFTHKVIQGFSVIWTTYIVDSNGDAVVFTGSEPLACEVWSGGNQAVTFNPAVSFNTASAGKIDVTYSSLNTATVAQGFYDVIISRTDTNTALASGYLSIAPAPGLAATDLITIPFARAALADYAMTDNNIQFLPLAISAASDVVRKLCGGRDFVQKTHVEEHSVKLDGTIMLNEPPNWITRIQGGTSNAITITNVSPSVQEAYVSANYSGDLTSGLTIAGLNLNSISSGTLTTSAVNFTANETIAGLGNAINAVGNGWTAYVDSSLSLWAVTELVGLQVPGGAKQGNGASYNVYADELGSDAKLDSSGTGLVWVGRQYSGAGPKWGPDWQEFGSGGSSGNRVKVTYNAGFATIPYIVQKVVASIAKNIIAVLSRDPTLMREKTLTYEYWLSEVVDIVPAQDMQTLATYRIHHA